MKHVADFGLKPTSWIWDKESPTVDTRLIVPGLSIPRTPQSTKLLTTLCILSLKGLETIYLWQKQSDKK